MGRDVAAITERLSSSQRGLHPCPLDVPFTTVCGAILGDLPPPPGRWSEHDSRVLRIALLSYEPIATAVDAARARWGDARVGLILATSTGGIAVTEDAYDHWRKTETVPSDYDMRRQHLFSAFGDVLAGVSGIAGPRYIVSTACSSSGKAIASAMRLMNMGVIDAAVVGGVDSLCHTTVRGFHSLGVLAETPCRPFAAERPGMNVGEAGAYLLLERDGDGPRVLGVGESSDAFHMSAPDPEGRGAARAMQSALQMAGLEASAIDHINAHGTGTRANDTAEAKAIEALFGTEVPVASTKGYTGHTLGAGGATEAVFSLIALREGFVPASVGASPVDPAVNIRISQDKLTVPLRHVLSNSFAFGGSNVSVLFGGA